MKKKREELDIIVDMLKVIKENSNSIKSTPLMRKSNLSYKLFKEYYFKLLKNELIRVLIDKKKRENITLTDKGFELISRYSEIKRMLKDFDL